MAHVAVHVVVARDLHPLGDDRGLHGQARGLIILVPLADIAHKRRNDHAQNQLYYHYGIGKTDLPEKLFGVYPHVVERRSSMLMRGFDDVFMVPHSRHTSVRREDIERCGKLKILASSEQAGVYAMATEGGRQIFITGHSEYDARTLESEYLRDKNAGLPIHVPENYYPDDDDTKPPMVTWRSHANLLYQNWLNYFVYQTTPYDLSAIRPV